MRKTLTEMAAEILVAQVKHESMTSKKIEGCLKEEDASLGNAGQPIITPEKSPRTRPEEPSKPAFQPKETAIYSTIYSTILNLIKSKPRGVDIKYIMEQTGYKKNQVWATVNKAKEKGQIKTTKRGIYVRA